VLGRHRRAARHCAPTDFVFATRTGRTLQRPQRDGLRPRAAMRHALRVCQRNVARALTKGRAEAGSGRGRTAELPDPPRGRSTRQADPCPARVGLTSRYPRCVANERSDRGLQSIELNDERVRAGLVALDEMTDAELRQLVQGEPQIIVEAAEGIIARRRSG
jgi:hypothetical protein